MISTTRDDLGIGIYTPQEAALYARVSTRLVNRWVFGDRSGQPVVTPQIRAQEPDKVLTFLDFIQCLAVRAIRTRFKVPLGKIRQAIDMARTEFRVEYPFAMKHTMYLFSDKKERGHGEILIRLPREQETQEDVLDKYVQLSGRERGNIVMNTIVELYLDDLEFNADGVANEYKPMMTDEGTISMDPRKRWGEPLVKSCGYSAQVLYEATNSEGSFEGAADAYGVSQTDVRLAFRYFDSLINATA